MTHEWHLLSTVSLFINCNWAYYRRSALPLILVSCALPMCSSVCLPSFNFFTKIYEHFPSNTYYWQFCVCQVKWTFIQWLAKCNTCTCVFSWILLPNCCIYFDEWWRNSQICQNPIPLQINYDARFIGFPVFIFLFLSLNFGVSLEKTFSSTYGAPTQRPVVQRELVSYNLNQWLISYQLCD